MLRPAGSVAQTATSVFGFNQFDFVAVRIFNKRDHGGAAFDRASFTRHVTAVAANTFTGFGCVVHFQRDMTISGAQLIAVHAPVVGQFDDRFVRFRAVTHKRQRVFIFRVFAGAQQFHTQYVSVEIDRTLQIANAQHGVK
ncbi:hypothetical protein EcWSU1_01900 [Enterobacter ludwigii]|uniref:Uncharacterized protein n=1 Tax=Enterobacter ludwigii TaxID=299767 RepID=G8LM65_9ENTR|nr:hypothetical protein EcWSU1_01900 [Enterobacter ludwigii]